MCLPTKKNSFAGILILIFHSWQISSIEILFIIRTLQISQWRLTGVDLKNLGPVLIKKLLLLDENLFKTLGFSLACFRRVIGAPKIAPRPFFWPMVKFIFFKNLYKSNAIWWASVLNTLRSNKKCLYKPGWPRSDFLMLFMHFLACQIFERAFLHNPSPVNALF